MRRIWEVWDETRRGGVSDAEIEACAISSGATSVATGATTMLVGCSRVAVVGSEAAEPLQQRALESCAPAPVEQQL
jgi:hypothetical protein